MREHGNKTEQRVEIETAQRPIVIAHSEVALREPRLQHQRQAYRKRGSRNCGQRQPRIQPDDPANCDDQFEQGTQELPAHPRQQPYTVRIMTALRHIGGQAAMKVSVPQLGNFFEKGDPQSCFEMPSNAHEARRDRQLQEHKSSQKNQHGSHYAEPLSR